MSLAKAEQSQTSSVWRDQAESKLTYACSFVARPIAERIGPPPRGFFVSNKSIRAVLVLRKNAGWSRQPSIAGHDSSDPKVDESAVRVRVYFSREGKSVSRTRLWKAASSRASSLLCTISGVHFVCRERTNERLGKDCNCTKGGGIHGEDDEKPVVRRWFR